MQLLHVKSFVCCNCSSVFLSCILFASDRCSFNCKIKTVVMLSCRFGSSSRHLPVTGSIHTLIIIIHHEYSLSILSRLLLLCRILRSTPARHLTNHSLQRNSLLVFFYFIVVVYVVQCSIAFNIRFYEFYLFNQF